MSQSMVPTRSQRQSRQAVSASYAKKLTSDGSVSVPKIKKRLSIDLQTKLAVIREVEKGAAYGEVMKKFGITAKSTISSIMKQRHKFMQAYQSESFDCSRKRMRSPKFKDVDQVVLEWVKSMSRSNHTLTGPIIKAKTRSLAQQMGLEFTASDGWFDRFCKRNSLVAKLIHGELSFDHEDGRPIVPSNLPDEFDEDEDDEVTIIKAETSPSDRIHSYLHVDDELSQDDDSSTPFVGCDVIINIPPNAVSVQDANKSLMVLKEYFKRDYSRSVSLALAVLEEKLTAGNR